MTNAGLVGRAGECRAVLALLETVRKSAAGRCRCSGASRASARRRCSSSPAREATGLRVLSLSATPSESDLPFAGLHALLRPLLPFLDELPEGQQAAACGPPWHWLPAPPPTGSPPTRRPSAWWSPAAAQQPLLILADDVHWLDVPSGEALSFTARRLAGQPGRPDHGERSGHVPPWTTPDSR